MLDYGVVPRIIPFGQQGTLHNPDRLYCARGHPQRNNLFNYSQIVTLVFDRRRPISVVPSFILSPPAGGFVNSVLPVGQRF